jgi:hypothetical protein
MVVEQKVFEADCIEHGDRFVTIFKTAETDLDKIYLYGKDLASGWGAECISVAPSTDFTDIKEVYNYDVEDAKSKAFFDKQFKRLH